MNATEEDQTYLLSVSGIDGIYVQSNTTLKVKATHSSWVPNRNLLQVKFNSLLPGQGGLVTKPPPRGPDECSGLTQPRPALADSDGAGWSCAAMPSLLAAPFDR